MIAGITHLPNRLTRNPRTWLGICFTHPNPGTVGKKLEAIAPAIAEAIKIAHILVLGLRGSAIILAKRAPISDSSSVDSPTEKRYITISFEATRLLGTLVAVIPIAVLTAIPTVTILVLSIVHILV
jgi:hypothetical protein